MTTSYRQLTQDVVAHLAPLHKGVPQVMKSFGEMGKAAIADGALNAKTKELIALAIGVAARCDGCIGFHAKALVKLGATAAEVHEALGVAIYMGGVRRRCTHRTRWPPSTSSRRCPAFRARRPAPRSLGPVRRAAPRTACIRCQSFAPSNSHPHSRCLSQGPSHADHRLRCDHF